MDAYWRHRDEIAALLDPRCYTIEWLDRELLERRMTAFGNDSAVIVVEVKNYPTGTREIHGMVAAGALDGILSLIDEAEQAARNEGIEFASIASRTGWARVLASRDYAVHQVEIRKAL